ncbi:MAG: luciferase family protein [Anaerolineales bacterium]
MNYYTEEASRALRESFEAEVLSWPEVTHRLMFGCPSYQAAGHLFAFLVDGGVVITQLRQADRETLAERCELSDFEVGERVVERWVRAQVENERDLGYVLSYVKKSYEIAMARAQGRV